MTEHPILFTGPMVRAILEGRKTMTRRVINQFPTTGYRWGGYIVESSKRQETGMATVVPEGNATYCCTGKIGAHCPYGQPEDRLWVRETWGVGCRPDPREGWIDGVEYRADQAYLDEIEDLPLYPVNPPDGVEIDDYVSKGWRPSIFMPRWASRITLEITTIRVERVQDISEEDAESEGVELDPRLDGYFRNYIGEKPLSTARDSFISLLDSINAKRGYGWDANPWTWVIEFKRVDP